MRLEELVHRPLVTQISSAAMCGLDSALRRTRGCFAGSAAVASHRGKKSLLLLLALCCIALAGCGGVVVAPNANASLSVNSKSVSFGDVAVNTPSTQSIVLLSSGSAPVTITGSTLSGAGFTISGLTTPATLTPGQTLTLNVQFLPTASGSVTGQLTLTTNSSTTPVLQIALAGGAGASAQGGAYQVNLSWNAPSGSTTGIAGYEIFRSPSGNPQYQLVSGSIVAPTSFTDPDVQSGITYDYYVTTIDVHGTQSPPSNIAEVAIP